jgi:hypothetical protein
MRPGIQLLLDLLRGCPQQTFGNSEWTALLGVAEQEDILPFAAERLRRLERNCTPEQRQQLNGILREAEVSTFVWSESLKCILAAFNRAALPVIPLKGPSLAERLYGNAALRTRYDLDFLVCESDLARAEHILKDLGFVPYGDADDYHRRWLRKAIIVELHHQVENPHAFAVGLEAVWSRSHLSDFQGVSIRLFNSADELLYLCLHAVRHRFERLNLILDLTFAFRILSAPSSGLSGWRAPVFSNALVLGWMMAAHLDSGIPALQPMRVESWNRRLQTLADRLWNEHLSEPARPLDWNAQHGFYLEVENPGWCRLVRRWRHLHILLTRVIDADFAFAERVHLHRSWQVRLLRPVRLLIKSLRFSPRML